jgi:two-component system, OmpR family, KDP operon response regulator KdpE
VAKILIIDDEPHFRRALRVALQVRGYEICEAARGIDGLKLIQAELLDLLDLVLVDWQMEGLDGLQTCREIRTESDVPIIMLTAKHGGRSQALAAGADDYLTKPFSMDDLAVRIESAMSRPKRHR